MDKNRKEKMNMRLAEKIFTERKRLGLSQEQFAEQMEVSRQAVSKWESGQSMPDLDKLVLMSQIFGVTTDYLLKEEGDITPEYEKEPTQASYSEKEINSSGDDLAYEEGKIRKLRTEEVEEYQAVYFKSAQRISWGVFLCIISVVLYSAVNTYLLLAEGITMRGGLAAVPILLCAAAAVAIFVSSSMRLERYTFFKTEPFILPEKEKERLEGEYEKFYKVFTFRITAGVVLCIAAVIGCVICNATYDTTGNPVWEDIAAMVLFAVIAIAVRFFVLAGMEKDCYDVLLQQNGFTRVRKKERKESEEIIGTVAGVYWCLVTTGYLGYSFITHDWGRSWIVWPVAGCLFGAISILITAARAKDTNS